MGVSTVGFVATDKKDFFQIVGTVTKAIRQLIFVPSGTPPIERMRMLRVETEVPEDARSALIKFTDGSDHRQLWVHFDCDLDYRDVYTGKKIILSLNRWGRSSEIIKAVGSALATVLDADFYFTASDCSGEDWHKNGVRIGDGLLKISSC